MSRNAIDPSDENDSDLVERATTGLIRFERQKRRRRQFKRLAILIVLALTAVTAAYLAFAWDRVVNYFKDVISW
jgi:hypothetical protein